MEFTRILKSSMCNFDDAHDFIGTLHAFPHHFKLSRQHRFSTTKQFGLQNPCQAQPSMHQCNSRSEGAHSACKAASETHPKYHVHTRAHACTMHHIAKHTRVNQLAQNVSQQSPTVICLCKMELTFTVMRTCTPHNSAQVSPVR